MSGLSAQRCMQQLLPLLNQRLPKCPSQLQHVCAYGTATATESTGMRVAHLQSRAVLLAEGPQTLAFLQVRPRDKSAVIGAGRGCLQHATAILQGRHTHTLALPWLQGLVTNDVRSLGGSAGKLPECNMSELAASVGWVWCRWPSAATGNHARNCTWRERGWGRAPMGAAPLPLAQPPVRARPCTSYLLLPVHQAKLWADSHMGFDPHARLANFPASAPLQRNAGFRQEANATTALATCFYQQR